MALHHDASADEHPTLASLTACNTISGAGQDVKKAGEVVEGRETEVKRQRDVWTFARRMGVDDPNWQLVATGD